MKNNIISIRNQNMALDLQTFLSQWQNSMKSAFVLNESSDLDTTSEGMSRIREWWSNSDNRGVIRLFMAIDIDNYKLDIDNYKLPETPREALACYAVTLATNEYITQRLKRAK